MKADMEDARRVLKETFGYEQFRPLQEQIIDTVLHRKRDALVVMPTGGGKSICYQIPALLSQNLTIVVSPLISLMKDQVGQLREYGVSASYLNSTLSSREYRDTLDSIRNGNLKLLYAAPETLSKDSILSVLEKVKPELLAIDEAHCISEWGHDFRPEYRQLKHIKKRLGHVNCMALTATATPHVRKDIREALELREPEEYIASFDRPNLYLDIQDKIHPIEQTLEFLENRKQESGIIYCFSRRQVEGLTEILQSRGHSACPYHAGLSENERTASQEAFIRDEVRIIVATIAFGMGIDKLNVRFVVHFDLPKNIEAYYQQIGRAGRDGLDAHCLMLFGYSDIQKIKYLIAQKPDEKEQRIAQNHLNDLVDFAGSQTCLRVPLLNYFGETYQHEYCNKCHNCQRSKEEKEDLTVPAQKFLSCVVRTGQRFGAEHIISVLRGSNNKRVVQLKHDTLSTHGIGKELSAMEWKQVSAQLIQQGYVQRESTYGSLMLNKRAEGILKNLKTFWGRLRGEQIKKSKESHEKYDYDKELFDLLKELRKEKANERGIPPYMVFADRTLIEMATWYPVSRETMLKVHGMGQAKMSNYGQEFLTTIMEYCDKNDISGDARKPGQSNRKSSLNGKGEKKYRMVGGQFNEGYSLGELVEMHNVQPGTIIKHLTDYALEGNKLRDDTEQLLSYSNLEEETIEGIHSVFKKEGIDRLRPVYDAMEQKISYGELHLIRLHYLMRNQTDPLSY